HGESDALRDATDLWIRGCQRWHTHELSLQIDQRTAAVAWVDWRAGLDHVRDGGRLAGDRAGRFRDGTVERAHDAGGDGAAEADRVANGQHRLAHTQTGRVAQRHDGQVRLADLNDGQIVERIQPDELALHRLIVGQGHLVGGGALGHVSVGENVALGVDDAPGAERLPAAEGMGDLHHRRAHQLYGPNGQLLHGGEVSG